ncbi:Uu.00g125230.m01.CDS01 [Anthostomella pinea]|uniref:3-phytase n=1 Tax=Anthostomella pinea TaxID=933095 RepID=A0AAI8YHN7_9PEZI|nr:Uu.00g125230.m01.CDS01 [Anthostomella pinea]
MHAGPGTKKRMPPIRQHGSGEAALRTKPWSRRRMQDRRWTVLGLTALLMLIFTMPSTTSMWKTAAWLVPAAFALPASGSACKFDIYKHFGNLSPYFVPSNTPESLQSGTPPGCTVEKAFLVHRHGSRNPLSDEITVIDDLAYYLGNNSALFSQPQAELPDEYAFLAEGWTSSAFTTNDLSAPGRQQLFDHGVAARLQYPTLYTVEVLAGDQDRVVESAVWFMDGYYGRAANSTATLHTIAEDNATVSWITSMDTCASWSYASGGDIVAAWGAVYLPPIAARLNAVLAPAYPGVNVTAPLVHGMLYACVYGTAVSGVGSSPWCPLFLPDEIRSHEYEYDLLMRGAFGYGLPGDMGAVLGSLLVANMTAFMQRDGGANLSLNFGHDTTIDLGLTALGLAMDSEYPTEGPVNATRAWRTSNQVPFAAQMLWRGLSCSGGDGDEKRIQLLLNEANFDLGPTGCASDGFGSCSLADFVATDRVRAALNVTHGDERWDAACSV